MGRFRNVVRGLLDRAEQALYRQYLLHALAQYRMENHQTLGNRDCQLETFIEKEREMLAALGIVHEPKLTDLERVLNTKFLIDRNRFDEMPCSDIRLACEADLTLEEWVRAGSITLLHSDLYNEIGWTRSLVTHVVKDRIVKDCFGCILVYREKLHYVHFNLQYDGMAKSWCWDINVRGLSGGEFLKEFSTRTERYRVARLRGLAIDHRLDEIELKVYRRDELVYPRALGRKVDDLVVALERWSDPTSQVARWGSLLIGCPGTGKTTIGGLLASHRPAGVTFLYFPASEVKGAETIKSVFRWARLLQPCILQIDDVDLIAADRRTSGSSTLCTAALMECLDGLEESARMFVVLTTNDASKMDPAVVNRAGRISTKIVFDGFEVVCGDILLAHAKHLGLRLDADDVSVVVREFEGRLRGFTPDEGKNICQRLYLRCLNRRQPTQAELREAILESRDAFHGEAAQQEFLAPLPVVQPQTNGEERAEFCTCDDSECQYHHERGDDLIELS